MRVLKVRAVSRIGIDNQLGIRNVLRQDKRVVIDFDDDRAAVVQVRHLRVRGQREPAVRGGGGEGVEALCAFRSW